MAQLRHDYPEFKDLGAEVLVMVPNGPRTIEKHVRQHGPAYPVLTDRGSKVASRYLQVKKFLSAGTPTVFLVDTTGRIVYAHYATSMIEEPSNQGPLEILRRAAG